MGVFHFPSTCSGQCVKVCIFCVILIVISSGTTLFSSPLNSFFGSLCCEINSKVSSLLHKMPFLLSTLQPTRRHVRFQRTNDVIIPVYSEYSAPQSRMLGIHSVYSRIGIATQSNGYSWLFHLFLFRNKVNRTHSESFLGIFLLPIPFTANGSKLAQNRQLRMFSSRLSTVQLLLS